MKKGKGFKSNHWTDAKGNVAGGCTYGRGFSISWQNGPLKSQNGDRIEANGAFVEDIIAAAGDRIAFYQQSKYKCEYNARALQFLRMAYAALQERTTNRQGRGVEGSHKK
jgi:hypothetical protein